MLSHVSSAPAHDYFHDPQDASHDGDQVAALQARIARIDQRIDELDFEKSELLKQVQQLTQVGGVAHPMNNMESQPNSQATERDVLVGGMDRSTGEDSDIANFPDDAESTLASYEAEMTSMFDENMLDGFFGST